MTDLRVTSDNRLVLTDAEISTLEAMVAKNDRAGFYLAYYQMTGNTEALLTSQISMFSGMQGGAAFAANWLLQNESQNGGPSYPGIYYVLKKSRNSPSMQLRLISHARIRTPDTTASMTGW